MLRNILIISIDNLRYDCCELHPDKRWLDKFNLTSQLRTPMLNAIAKRSIYFTNAFSTATYTTNAHASLFTGLYPPKHGVRSFFKHCLGPEVTTLADLLRQNSYSTIFMSDNRSLFEFTNLLQGFSHFVSNEDELIELIKAQFDRPIFAFAHFLDVHDPYLFSPIYGDGNYNKDYFDWLKEACGRYGVTFSRGEHARSYYELFYKLSGDIEYFFPLYIAGVNKFDAGRFARFYRRLDSELHIWGDWVVVVLSDHGEGRIDDQQPRMFRHEGLLFDEVMRIVLMLSYPSSQPALYDNLVSIVDVFPTLLSMTGFDNQLDMFQQDVDGMAIPNHRTSIYAETWQRHHESLLSSFDNDTFLWQRVIRSDNRKYILNGTPERFFLEQINSSTSGSRQALWRGLLCKFEPKEGNNDAEALCNENDWKAKRLLQIVRLDEDPFETQTLDLDTFNLKDTVMLLNILSDIYRLEAHAVKPTEIELFADLAKRVQDVLAQIAGGSLVIYGAGEHTKMLFQKTPIREGNVVAIADSDSGKWGSEVEGFQIISPTSLLEMNPDGILISSHAFEMEIFEFLVNELRISENKIFRLYGVQSDSAEEYSAEEAELITKRLKDLGYL